MRFRITGDCVINNEASKNPYVRTGKTKNGNTYETFSCAIKAAKNNTVFAELFGMESDTIHTMDSDNSKIDVSWEDRFDDEVVAKVANYKKNVINITDDRKEFIAPYDAVKYLVKNVDEVKGKRIIITGQVNKNVYQGKLTNRFQMQNVYLATEDDKNGFKCTDMFYFSKDSFDTADWREEHKLIINGWIKTYIAEEKKNMYVPQTIIFDCSKVDWDNEKHRNRVNYILKQMKCNLTDDNKIKVSVGKTIYAIPVELTYFNGAQAEEITLEDLSPNQREAIELGIKELKDFVSNVYGERITEFKLKDFDLTGDYSEGAVDTEIKLSELEEELFEPKKEEKLDDIMNKPTQAVDNDDTEEDDDDSDEDLFS